MLFSSDVTTVVEVMMALGMGPGGMMGSRKAGGTAEAPEGAWLCLDGEAAGEGGEESLSSSSLTEAGGGEAMVRGRSSSSRRLA